MQGRVSRPCLSYACVIRAMMMRLSLSLPVLELDRPKRNGYLGAYSLGNFVFGGLVVGWSVRRYGVMLPPYCF